MLVLAALLVVLSAATARPFPLQEAELTVDPATPEPGTAEIESLFTEATAIFNSERQPESIALFDRIISQLTELASPQVLTTDETEILIRSLVHRAEALFNLGETPKAEEDLRRIISRKPDIELDATRISPKFLDLLEEKRSTLVGSLQIVVEPGDAVVDIDGTPIVGGFPHRTALLAGEYTLAVSRPGFAGASDIVIVEAGREQRIEIGLERESATLEVRTNPSAVTIELDGRDVGMTRRASLEPSAEGTAVSKPLIIDAVIPGEHLVVASKDGFRTREVKVTVSALADYQLEPLQLEPTSGELEITGIPKGARLVINGVERLLPEVERATFTLPVGPHGLSVSAGTAGGYEREFALADRESLTLAVELRPTLALLGVLADDADEARDLVELLQDHLGRLGAVSFQGAPDGALDLLRDELELGLKEMRAVAANDLEPAARPDWSRMQSVLDARFGSSLYLLATGSGDWLAGGTDLWIWASAPGPPAPARLHIGREDSVTIEQALNSAFRPPILERAWLGAILIDSELVTSPVVLSVADGGPAAAAGIHRGDRITSADGRGFETCGLLVEYLDGLRAGSSITIGVQGPGGARELRLTMGTSPVIAVGTEPGIPPPVLSALVVAEQFATDHRSTRWVLDLNLAVALLRSGSPSHAAKVLSEIEAPSQLGIGRGTVDYLLGKALLAIDPVAYADAAREALVRAAEDSGARLGHGAGPLTGPRARARLSELTP